MEQVFTVTLVRPSSGLPSIEVGAYEYLGARLPAVGDTIGIRPVSSPGGDVVRGYVSRVDPGADTPIWVTALPDDSGPEPVEVLYAAERDAGHTGSFPEAV